MRVSFRRGVAMLLLLAVTVGFVPSSAALTLPADVPPLPADDPAASETDPVAEVPSPVPVPQERQAESPSEKDAPTSPGSSALSPGLPAWFAAAVAAAGVAVGLAARRLGPSPSPKPSPRPPVDAPGAPNASQRLAHGFTLLEQHRFAQAVEPLRIGLRSRPTDPVTRYALASALARSGQVSEALRQFDYAIRLNERFLALFLKDPELHAFTRRPDVHRFIRAHAARYRERVERPYA